MVLTESQIQQRLQDVYNSVVRKKKSLDDRQEYLHDAFRHALMGVVLCADALEISIEEVKQHGQQD